MTSDGLTRRNVAAGGACYGLAAMVTVPLTSAGPATARTALPFLAGINLAGAEFGDRFPGTHGTDYIHPEPEHLARYCALGFNVVRLPFRWERLQPDIDGPFEPAEWQRIAANIDAAARWNAYIILDVHNYARRRLRTDGFRNDHMIGSPAVPVPAFGRFWQELATRVAGREHVILGLMNEPYDIAAAAWLSIAQHTVDAIRRQSVPNLILVPGTAYSGAHSWHRVGNDVLARLSDPADNWAVDVHQYLDRDSSGRDPQAVSPSVGLERIGAFQQWARRHRLRAFLGEFGGGGDDVTLAAMRGMLAQIADNRDVWLGWAAWAAGPWWPPDYGLRLEPDATGALPAQTRLLMEMARHATARPTP